MKRLLRWEEIMIIEQVIYRITHFFQGTIDWLQQINFIGGCDRDNGETISFVIGKSKKATFIAKIILNLLSYSSIKQSKFATKKFQTIKVEQIK